MVPHHPTSSQAVPWSSFDGHYNPVVYENIMVVVFILKNEHKVAGKFLSSHAHSFLYLFPGL